MLIRIAARVLARLSISAAETFSVVATKETSND
jgi:hypothetical protein